MATIKYEVGPNNFRTYDSPCRIHTSTGDYKDPFYSFNL